MGWVTMLDQICLTKIRGYGYTGALPEEQVLGQWFEVDVTLWLDLSQAGNSDRLEDTLNYCTIIDPVKRLISTAKFVLLERLATAIADLILYPPSPHAIPVQQVRVRLIKPHAPIPDFDGTITIELIRSLNTGDPQPVLTP
jgi:7,8-dihydroneopterin aldolase/epimerase/oxygenase